MPRSIAGGEDLDFRPTWDLFSPTSGTSADIERAIRRHDLQRIPYDVQHSKNRIVGPSVQAISNFASAVKESFNGSLSKFDHLLENKRRLVAAINSSNVPHDNKIELINELQRNLEDDAAELFVHVGGTPPVVAEKLLRFGE
jgi:hypothetical protein